MGHVDDKDFGLQAIYNNLQKLSEIEIKAGIQAGSVASDGSNLAEIAAYNEYGTDKIPSRPFLRNAIKDHDNWNSHVDSAVNLVIDGMPPMQAAGLVGQAAEAGIRESILDGDFVPNAPSTIARKGSSKPLIDKGTLVGAIRYKIEQSN